MTFVSYAQNYEDVMLWRALQDIENGYYVDVGANDPTVHSVTKAFYMRGWRGINIEPVQQYYRRLCDERPDDINLPVAVANEEGDLTFYEIAETGLSTLDRATAEKHRQAGWAVTERKVSVVPLNRIFEQHVKGSIHFLKIDVGGAEEQVLQGLDLSRWRPWIIVIEATKALSPEMNFSAWDALLLSEDYRMVYFDGLNQFYVARENFDIAERLKTPPNFFDDFIRYEYKQALEKRETLQIEFDKIKVEQEKAGKQLKQLRTDREETCKRLDKTWSNLEATRKRLDEIWADRENLRKQLDQARADSDKIRSKLNTVEAERDRVQAQIDRIRTDKTRIQQKLDALEVDRERIQTQAENLLADRERLQAQLFQIRVDRNRIQEQLDHVWRERHEYWSQLDTIYRSRSWRLLGPFRKLSGKIRFWSERINRIIHQPFSYSVAKSLSRLKIRLQRLKLGDHLLHNMKVSYPRFWHRVAGWTQRSAQLKEEQTASPKIEPGDQQLSTEETYFLELFQRELSHRQKE